MEEEEEEEKEKEKEEEEGEKKNEDGMRLAKRAFGAEEEVRLPSHVSNSPGKTFTSVGIVLQVGLVTSQRM